MNALMLLILLMVIEGKHHFTEVEMRADSIFDISLSEEETSD